MSERLLDLAERPLYLRFENSCLVLEDREKLQPPLSIPVGEPMALSPEPPGRGL